MQNYGAGEEGGGANKVHYGRYASGVYIYVGLFGWIASMSVPMMQVYGLQWTGFYLPTEHLGVRKNSLKRVRGFQIELEFGSFSFHGRKKLEYTEKNPSGRRREQTTNSTHIWLRRWDSNPGLIGGRRVFSPLRQPFSFKCNFFFNLMELLNFLIIFLLC